jgi:formylglycine-generating enzyme required for sulfatase activity
LLLACGTPRKRTTAEIPGGTLSLGTWTAKIPDFRIDRYEVSVSDYQKCTLAGRCSRRRKGGEDVIRCSEGRDDPVDCVTVQQAAAFCEWVGGRLPTAAEWAWTATGRGQNRNFPWGDSPRPDCEHAYTSNGLLDARDTSRPVLCSERGMGPVSSLPASASRDGVLHMYGNATEFVIHRKGAETLGAGWEEGYMPMTEEYFSWILREGDHSPLSIDDPRGWPGTGFRCAYDRGSRLSSSPEVVH